MTVLLLLEGGAEMRCDHFKSCATEWGNDSRCPRRGTACWAGPGLQGQTQGPFVLLCLVYVAAGAESCSENWPLLGVGLRGWVRTVIVRRLHIESKVSGT